MNRLKITQEIFEKHCSSATNSNDTVFMAVEYGFSLSEQRIATFLGLEVFEELPGNILSHFERAVCLDTYAEAIPHLDLVLTSTGFGIVSTSNVAPASADRVNRLSRTLLAAFEDTIDDILSLLRFESAWNDSVAARSLISSVFWSGRQLRRYGFPLAHRSDLVTNATSISTAENKLREFIGDEIMTKLLDSIRTASSTPKELTLLQLIEHVVAANISGCDGTEFKTLLNSVARYLLNNIDSFPEFANSSAYAALKIVRYENKKDDSCYFFG